RAAAAERLRARSHSAVDPCRPHRRTRRRRNRASRRRGRDHRTGIRGVTQEPAGGPAPGNRPAPREPGIRVGCAGWAIPKPQAERFPGPGSHLERYARRFAAVEINSSFYRPHRPATYARWAASVAEGFRFSVKMPREITHRRRLREVGEPLDRFLGEAGALGSKLGVLLVQLPPSLRFEPPVAEAFLSALRDRYDG